MTSKDDIMGLVSFKFLRPWVGEFFLYLTSSFSSSIWVTSKWLSKCNHALLKLEQNLLPTGAVYWASFNIFFYMFHYLGT